MRLRAGLNGAADDPIVFERDDACTNAESPSALKKKELRVRIKTTTPIYGGSALAGKPDLLMPFRPRAIRNGVAQWWWAVNRHQAQFRSDPDLLWTEYALTFGARAGAEFGGASPFTVKVTRPNASATRCAYWWPYEERNGQLRLVGNEGLGYALFVARGEALTNAPAGVASRIHSAWAHPNQVARLARFSMPSATSDTDPSLGAFEPALNAAFPEKTPSLLALPGLTADLQFIWQPVRTRDAGDEVEQQLRVTRLRKAVGLWLCWGGLGGRTSRGLGAFDAEGIGDTGPWAIAGHTFGDALTCGPLLTGDDGSLIPGMLLLRMNADHEGANPVQLLAKGLEEYRALRQTRLNRHTFSFLPDADAMRALQGTRKRGHEERHPAVTSGAGGRKVFSDLGYGAPIVMEFKREDVPGDPRPAQIGFEFDGRLARYPSPFRFRPVRVEAGSARYTCAALFTPSRSDLKDRGLLVKFGDQTRQIPKEVWQFRDPTGKFEGAAEFQAAALAGPYGIDAADVPIEARKFGEAVQAAQGLGAPALVKYLASNRSGDPSDPSLPGSAWVPVNLAQQLVRVAAP